MTWHIEFVSPSKRSAVKALMRPGVQKMRGLPVAVREQIIALIESLAENDGGAFISVRTFGHIPGPCSSSAANMTIEVGLVSSYIVPFPDDTPEMCEAGVLHPEAPWRRRRMSDMPASGLEDDARCSKCGNVPYDCYCYPTSGYINDQKMSKEIIGIRLPVAYKNAFDFARDCGVETFNVAAPVITARDALIDAAQFIDTVRQDAQREGWWTSWDQEMRDKITKALESIDGVERMTMRPRNGA